MDALEKHIKKQPTLSSASNVWIHEGKTYFYEIGLEHEDGAITGYIHRMDSAFNPSPFLIEPDGKIVDFPFTV